MTKHIAMVIITRETDFLLLAARDSLKIATQSLGMLQVVVVIRNKAGFYPNPSSIKVKACQFAKTGDKF